MKKSIKAILDEEHNYKNQSLLERIKKRAAVLTIAGAIGLSALVGGCGDDSSKDKDNLPKSHYKERKEIFEGTVYDNGIDALYADFVRYPSHCDPNNPNGKPQIPEYLLILKSIKRDSANSSSGVVTIETFVDNDGQGGIGDDAGDSYRILVYKATDWGYSRLDHHGARNEGTEKDITYTPSSIIDTYHDQLYGVASPPTDTISKAVLEKCKANLEEATRKYKKALDDTKEAMLKKN